MKNAIRAGVHSIEHATLMDDESATLFTHHGVYMVPTLSALATTAACKRGCGIPDSALDKAKAMTKRHQASFRQALQIWPDYAEALSNLGQVLHVVGADPLQVTVAINAEVTPASGLKIM